ncbi:zinc finger BED domain-containing protein 5 isoform X3 [Cavia porcellus]|uniref:zinc finger BED domain-containing protein 5 isoform X3 n=1 Tax=Cavia porcellus TaxID=10141 RepID=UPI002FE0A2ED
MEVARVMSQSREHHRVPASFFLLFCFSSPLPFSSFQSATTGSSPCSGLGEESTFQAAKVESDCRREYSSFQKGVPYLRAPASHMRDHLINEHVIFHLRFDP